VGLQRLHARSNAGIALKTLASLIALAIALQAQKGENVR